MKTTTHAHTQALQWEQARCTVRMCVCVYACFMCVFSCKRRYIHTDVTYKVLSCMYTKMFVIFLVYTYARADFDFGNETHAHIHAHAHIYRKT